MSRILILDAAGNAVAYPWQLPPPEPDPPGSFTHGDEIFRHNVGRADGFYALDTRTVLAAPTEMSGGTLTAADNGSEFVNVKFTGKLKIDGDATITFKHCLFDGPVSTSSGQYLLQLLNGGTAIVEDSTLIGRFPGGKTIYLSGSGGIWAKRCLIMGSQDVFHGTADGDQRWPDYVAADFVGARAIFEDCWIGDALRNTTGHVDNWQWDNQGGNAVLKRCKLPSYSIVYPDLPRTSVGDPTIPGNFAVGLTYGSVPGTLRKFSLESCRFDGGNNTLGVSGDGGVDVPELVGIHDCHFGADESFMFEGSPYVGVYRYSPIVGGTHKSNNIWAVTGNVLRLGVAGSTPTAIPVTTGSPVT